VKSKEAKTGSNLEEFSKESYDSKKFCFANDDDNIIHTYFVKLNYTDLKHEMAGLRTPDIVETSQRHSLTISNYRG
jgi:hypothetical protein